MTKNKNEPTELLNHVGYSAIATLVAHPSRVCLNRASTYQWPHTTIRYSFPYLFRGIGLNFFRGSLATGSQSYAKEVVQERTGILSAGIGAAAFCGTVIATGIETPFIRKTMIQGQAGTSFSLMRFSPTLSSLYFCREAGFSLAVLSKNDLSINAQYGVLLVGAWITAVTHKFVALEATRDQLPQGMRVPHFKDGLFTTIKSMAHGNVYTHPGFQAPFKNPASNLAKIGNLMHVSCGINMYVFRLLYLAIFREAYQLSAEYVPVMKTKIGCF
jgi:hypothetical protein